MSDQRGTRQPSPEGHESGRAEESSESSSRSDAALLPLYLKQMGEVPLLTREQEVSLSREIKEARVAIAKLLLQLPRAIRDQVVLDPKGPKLAERWPLAQLDAATSRLSRLRGQVRDTKTRALLLKVAAHQLALERAREAMTVANLRLLGGGPTPPSSSAASVRRRRGRGGRGSCRN